MGADLRGAAGFRHLGLVPWPPFCRSAVLRIHVDKPHTGTRLGDGVARAARQRAGPSWRQSVFGLSGGPNVATMKVKLKMFYFDFVLTIKILAPV